MFQHHCDICKKTENILIVKVPECIYFCIDCASKDEDTSSRGRYTLDMNNKDNVSEFRKILDDIE